MEKRQLGRTDISVPALCLGTMMYGDQIPETEAFRQMDACLDRGINFFDTAELYTIPPKPETLGNSERILGRWLAERKNRDQLIIASKVIGFTRNTYIRGGETARLTRKDIEFAVERSLKNLQTDYIDLYQTHWPDRSTPSFGAGLRGYRYNGRESVAFEETLSAMDALVKAGKIRHVGVSNETPYGVMRQLFVSETQNLPRIVSIQNAYNLINRTFEDGLAEIAHREQVGLLAYSPLGQGALSGKYLDGQMPVGSRQQLFGRFERYLTPGAEPAIRHYVELARDFGIDPSVFAMQFVTSRPFVTSNIFGARTKEQLDLIFESIELTWTDEMETAVNKAYALFRSPSP